MVGGKVMAIGDKLRGKLQDKITGKESKKDKQVLADIIEELKGSVEAHRSQHERLQKVLDNLK